ncbi:MAG TPA: LacI family DNA-binding transcriptional regulator [Microlunatus sp.]
MATAPRRTAAHRGGQAKRPTATDVARRAGVSQATVSYVMNDTPHQVIPEPTRQRVLAAATELGYTPSAAARMLVSGKSDVVLLLLPDWPIGLGVASLLDELSQAFAHHDLTFVIHPQVTARPITDLWKSITPAAVLAYENFSESDLTAINRSGAELVLISSLDHGARAMDQSVERTGRIQVEHLARAGHRHLGYAWPDDDRVLFFAQHRLDGVRGACAELGLPAPRVTTVSLTADGGAAAIRGWRAAGPAVTGICAFNDEVALAVLAGARQLGVVIPDDLAVIGVDDIPAAALAAPPLTTVASNITATVLDIVDAVLGKLDGRPAEPRSTQPGADRVISRASA